MLAAVARNEFDTAPLSWVKREIQIALDSADKNVDQFTTKPSDHEIARVMLSHLHQVSGALQMVGLKPIAQISVGLEKLVGALHCGDVKADHEITSTVRQAIRTLNRYLEALVRGEPNRPLSLYPTYRAVIAATGSSTANAVDLFYPDLSLHPKFTFSAPPLTGNELVDLLTQKRAEFQKGLLLLLRGGEHQQGLRLMHSALAALEAAQPAGTRTFSWIAVGFFEGLMRSSTPPNVSQKQLCGRIDLELKRQSEGVNTVSERLMRQFLLAIALMQPSTVRLREIHKTYRLGSLLPPTAQEAAEHTRTTMLVQQIREQLDHLKETWLSFATGNRDALNQFVQHATQLDKFARSLDNKHLQAVFANLAEVGNNLMANPRDPGDALALETATELLAAREALENYDHLGENFEKCTKTIVMRVAAALRGRPLPGNAAKQLADVSWSAYEKQLILQLGQEILANLKHIEEILDTFFRDPTKRKDLAILPTYIKQIQGALIMLESEDAVSLLKAGRDLVQKFASSNDIPDLRDAERAAEAFSNVGLFVSALQQGRANPEELLQTVLNRLEITPSLSKAQRALKIATSV